MKDLKVSKELIEEVMKDKGTFETININKNELSTFGVLGHHIFSINIYEFAFKCKEWILNQKNKDCFYIADQFSLNIEIQMGIIKYFWCVLLKNNSRVSPEFKADSELEAVIKASEYILKEINENR